jgi:hypothetical protein
MRHRAGSVARANPAPFVEAVEAVEAVRGMGHRLPVWSPLPAPPATGVLRTGFAGRAAAFLADGAPRRSPAGGG